VAACADEVVKEDLTHPHDALFKRVFAVPEHAASELRAVLPTDVAQRVDWSTCHR